MASGALFALCDNPALHDKADLLEPGDINRRIAVNRDQVCRLAGFKRANLFINAEQPRRVDRGRLNRGNRRHPVFDEHARLSDVRGCSSGKNLNYYYPKTNSVYIAERIFRSYRFGHDDFCAI